MNIPSLPYDSLYKFTFIAGIILCVTSLYLRNEIINNLPDSASKIDSITREYHLATLKAGMDTAKVNSLLSFYNRELARAGSKEGRISQKDVQILKYNIAKLRYQSDSAKIEYRILKNRFDLRYHLGNRSTYLAKQYSLIAFVSIVFSILGCIFWYREQRIYDLIQKYQLEILKRQLGEKKERNAYRMR